MSEHNFLFSFFSPEAQRELFETIQASNLEAMQKIAESYDPTKKFVNQTQLKKMLGIGQDTLDEMIANGLPIYKVGRQSLVKLSEVEDVITQKYKI